MSKPLLIGEANPYGADPEYALYPYPERATGDRLCRLVMQLEPDDYLDRFDRVNLCPQHWSQLTANQRAEELVASQWTKYVLLGAKVARAFCGTFDPFTIQHGPRPSEGERKVYVTLPHPSGLCRMWGQPGAFERARKVLREVGVL